MEKIKSVYQAGLKILYDPNDPERKPKPVTTYRLSPEEIEARYGKPTSKRGPVLEFDSKQVKQIRANESEDKEMNKLDVNDERLMEICRELGTGKEGIEKIASEFKLTAKQASNQIYIKKINRRLEAEKKETQLKAAIVVKAAAAEVMIQESVPDPKLEPVQEPVISPAKTKYYIATALESKERAAKLAEIIKAAGGEITCEWWNFLQVEIDEQLAEIGQAELQAIADCDVLVCMVPGYHGTYSELGAAVALGKQVIMHAASTEDYGLKPAPFSFCKNVTRLEGSELDLVAEVLMQHR